MTVESKIRFPGETEEYRQARERLLAGEIGLRRATEDVAAARRALPAGARVPEDYAFEGEDGAVPRSELFSEGKPTLLLYSFMYGPKTECAGGSCTSILDSRDGAAHHGETPDGDQMPMLNMFVRDGATVRHSWGSELLYTAPEAGQDQRDVDTIWPIWNLLDLAPGGRGADWNPRLSYD